MLRVWRGKLSRLELALRVVSLFVACGLLYWLLDGALRHGRLLTLWEQHGGIEWRRALLKLHGDQDRWRRAECGALSLEGTLDQWASISRRPIVVELWQSHHFRGGDFWPNATEKCRGDVDCVFVRSLKPMCFDEADAVVFNGALVDGIPNSKAKIPNPLHVFFYTKSREDRVVNSGWDAWVLQFDLEMSLDLESHVPLTHFGDLADHLSAEPMSREDATALYKQKRPLISLFVSNCNPRSGRNALIADVMLKFEVASFGRCFKSNHSAHGTAKVDKHVVMRQFPFNLAIESAWENDYVTRVFFDCLRAAVICIYMGAPNIGKYAPAKSSFINMRDFASIDDLAAHVERVASNYSLYQSYFAWRDSSAPKKSSFLALQETTLRSGPCRLCQAVATHLPRAGRRGFLGASSGLTEKDLLSL